MIIEALFNIIYTLITSVFRFIPNLPSFDVTILDSVTYIFDLIFSHTGLLGFFIHVSTIKILVPLVILALNFEEVYHFAMWLIKKLPIGVK